MGGARNALGPAVGAGRQAAGPAYPILFLLALLLLGSSLFMGAVRAVRLFGAPPIGTDATVLGRALLERGEYAPAVREFRLAGLIDPERYDPPPELAVQPSRSRAADDAFVSRQRQRARERPDAAAAHLSLGRALLQWGDPAESVRSLERARDLDPQLSGLYVALGRAYLAAGRLPEAEDSFRDAMERDPPATAHYDGLGLALYGMGRLEEAEDAFQRGQDLREAAATRTPGSDP